MLIHARQKSDSESVVQSDYCCSVDGLFSEQVAMHLKLGCKEEKK